MVLSVRLMRMRGPAGRSRSRCCNQIACKARNKQIQAEIHDFRATAVACPASSADLPAVRDATLRCKSWNVLLHPANPVGKVKTPQPLISPFPSEVNDKQWELLGDDGDKQLLEIVFPVADGVANHATKADSLRQPLSLSRSINGHQHIPATTATRLSDYRSQSAAQGHASPLAHASGSGKGSDSKHHHVTSHTRSAGSRINRFALPQLHGE